MGHIVDPFHVWPRHTAHPARGYTEQLPSAAWLVTVRAGSDPLTGKPIRLRATAKTWERAQADLARLLEEASAGRRPDGDAAAGELLKQYAAVADGDLSTREANDGYIRRTILPALGEMKLRHVRGPVLDALYARLRKCGNLACTGGSFVEHSSFPVLSLVAVDRRPAWQQVAGTIREAIKAGQLVIGDPLPSVRELAEQHGVCEHTRCCDAAVAGVGHRVLSNRSSG